MGRLVCVKIVRIVLRDRLDCTRKKRGQGFDLFDNRNRTQKWSFYSSLSRLVKYIFALGYAFELTLPSNLPTFLLFIATRVPQSVLIKRKMNSTCPI